MKDDAVMTMSKERKQSRVDIQIHIKIPTYVARKSSTVQFQYIHYIFFHCIY